MVENKFLTPGIDAKAIDSKKNKKNENRRTGQFGRHDFKNVSHFHWSWGGALCEVYRICGKKSYVLLELTNRTNKEKKTIAVTVSNNTHEFQKEHKSFLMPKNKDKKHKPIRKISFHK